MGKKKVGDFYIDVDDSFFGFFLGPCLKVSVNGLCVLIYLCILNILLYAFNSFTLYAVVYFTIAPEGHRHKTKLQSGKQATAVTHRKKAEDGKKPWAHGVQ